MFKSFTNAQISVRLNVKIFLPVRQLRKVPPQMQPHQLSVAKKLSTQTIACSLYCHRSGDGGSSETAVLEDRRLDNTKTIQAFKLLSPVNEKP